MIGWLVGLLAPTVGEKAAKPLALVIVIAFAALALYLLLDAYGDSRYREGKKDADAAWIAASNKLIAKAQNAGKAADKNAAVREADFAAKVEDEKERINAAQKDGTSPFDVLFGNSN